MKYWPGTNIVKSKNNAFDWRSRPSRLVDRDLLNSQQATLTNTGNGAHKSRAFTIYSRAKASK